MKTFFTSLVILYAIITVSCSNSKKTTSKYPDCSSNDISKMDTCLLGMTLREAISKLKIDTSQLHVIEEPIAMLRGISFRLNDSSEINLYVQKTLIKDKRDSLEFSKRYLFIIDRPIKTIRWTKDAGETYKTVFVLEKE